MGFALAEECARRGAEVTLIAGPVQLKTQHSRIHRIDVESAQEMYEAAQTCFPTSDLSLIHISSVQVEWIFVKTRMVKKYYFERIKGAWILEAINLRPVERNENEDFVAFFSHFAADSLFQSRRVQEPLAFVTSDPDDDFSILETSLDLNQWFAFKPALPTDRLSNINYGQRNDDNSPTKIRAWKGIGNGFSNSLYFRRKAGEWQLYKLSLIHI